MGAGLQAALDRLGPPAPGVKQQIVLLTDGYNNEGLSNQQILDGPARQAKDRGIPIYSVGFGLVPITVDQQFLADLARATNGAYVFADSPAALNATLVSYQAYQTGQVLGEFRGTLDPGRQVVAGSLAVPPGKQLLRLALNVASARPANVSMRLVAPDGRVLDPNAAGARAEARGSLTLVTLDNPAPGTWKVQLTSAAGQAEGPTPYALTASTDGVSTGLPIGQAASTKRGPDRWRPLLIAGSAVAGALALLFLILALRGLFGRRASTAGGCLSGCLTLLLVLVIGVGWGGYLLWNAPLFGP